MVKKMYENLSMMYAKALLGNSKSKVKGGINMETKSRYEIIRELEEKKHEYMMELNSVNIQEKRLEHQIETAKEELDEFKVDKELKIQTLKDMIESIEKSLKRFESQKK